MLEGKKIKDMHNLKKPSETLLDMMTLLIFLLSPQIYSITVINLVPLIAHPSNVRQKPKLKNRTAEDWGKSEDEAGLWEHEDRSVSCLAPLPTTLAATEASFSLPLCLRFCRFVCGSQRWPNPAHSGICCLGTGLAFHTGPVRDAVGGAPTGLL